jgi:hypothetical protein
MHDRVFYYSTNCVNWGLLPLPTDYAKKLVPLCTARFQGDPALVLDVLLEKDEIAFGEPLTEPQVRKLKEEDRLSATIHLINHEVLVVPRGALYKRADGAIVESLAFEGILSTWTFLRGAGCSISPSARTPSSSSRSTGRECSFTTYSKPRDMDLFILATGSSVLTYPSSSTACIPFMKTFSKENKTSFIE